MIRKANFTTVMITAILLILAAGCQRVSERNESAALTLNIVLPGNGMPEGMDRMKEEVERRLLLDNLPYKLNIMFIPWDELRPQTEVLLASGRELDLIYDAPWLHAHEMSNAGYYQPLDDLLRQFGPDILASRPQDMIAANRIKARLYGVPLGAYGIPLAGYLVRKDVREQLGIPPIRTYDDLLNFFYRVKAKNPDLIPFAPDLGDPLYTGTYKLNFDAQANIRDVGLTAYSHFLYLKGNDGFVYSLFSEKENAIWDAIRENRTFYQDGIVNRNLLTDRESLFEEGKAAVTTTRILGIDKAFELNLRQRVPEARLEYVTFFHTGERLTANYKQAGMIAIPTVSRHKEEAVKFLNWANKKENYDLLAYGLEGENWIADGENGYRTTEIPFTGIADYLVRNPVKDRTDFGQTKDVQLLGQWLRDQANFRSDPLAGFTFDPSLVFTDYTVFVSLVEKYNLPLTLGIVDMDSYFTEFRAQAEESASNVRREMQQQIKIYLDKWK